jgi:putative hydrolase of the HAD superfamily
MIIVFDMDDTLYLELDFVRSGFRAVDDWLAAELRVDGFFAIAWHLLEGGQRARVFDDALAALGVAAGPGLIPSLVEVYRGHRPTIQLAPDAARALERHAGRDRLALLTDGYLATQERKIEALGLRSCCDPVIITDQWGRDYWKPHPRGFMAIQSRFEREPADFVYVGDNPGKDFLGPKALGWKTIRIRRAGGLHAAQVVPPGHDADLTITTLDELDRDDVQGFLAARSRLQDRARPLQPQEALT